MSIQCKKCGKKLKYYEKYTTEGFNYCRNYVCYECWKIKREETKGCMIAKYKKLVKAIN